MHAATCLVEAVPAISSSRCVCLPRGYSDEAWLHCRACHVPLAGDLQQAAGSTFAGAAEASNSCKDELPARPA